VDERQRHGKLKVKVEKEEPSNQREMNRSEKEEQFFLVNWPFLCVLLKGKKL